MHRRSVREPSCWGAHSLAFNCDVRVDVMRVSNGQHMVSILSDELPVEHIPRVPDSGASADPCAERLEVERDLQDVMVANGGVLQTPPRSNRTGFEGAPGLPLETGLVMDQLHHVSRVHLVVREGNSVFVHSKPVLASARKNVSTGLWRRLSDWCLICWRACFRQRPSAG